MYTGIKVPKILLPNEDVDLTKWAVVACDQFTSEPKYWETLKETVSGSPSMLNIIFPEVYLSSSNEEKIEKINASMNEYLHNNILTREVDGFILTVRQTPHAERRVGIVAMIDLEDYSFKPSDRALIRATEGTILGRIPPRVKIREKSPLESPHIMLLFDDRKNEIIEPIYNGREKLQKLYDFDLNMGGGHITGYHITDTDEVIEKFSKLLTPEVLTEKYGSDDKFLFAVGDGNHSLATAKACWEQLKTKLDASSLVNHPARFALVEIVNIYDCGLEFEPIHRVVFGATKAFEAKYREKFSKYSGEGVIITKNGCENIGLSANAIESVNLVQGFIDEAISVGLCKEVDYVHGRQSVEEIVAANENAFGILLPSMNKEDLFREVLQNGVLPRKTFSMGEAVEKRYYLECRRIVIND